MAGSADYGKEMRASLDWSDGELLGEMLKRRLTFSLEQIAVKHYADAWGTVAVSHYRGEHSLNYIIERSLMRPRNLLKLFRYCLSYAVKMRREKIGVEDIAKGMRIYSQDLLIEVNREISDVYPEANGLIYEFLGESVEFTRDEILLLMKMKDMGQEQSERVLDFLLYYGIIGVKKDGEDPVFIYDVNYNVNLLTTRMRKWAGATRYRMNAALWSALELDGSGEAPLV